MRPAQIAAARKPALPSTILIVMASSGRVDAEKARFGKSAPGSARCASPEARRSHPCKRRLHVLHHRFRLFVVDDVGNRQNDRDVAIVLPPVLDAEILA